MKEKLQAFIAKIKSFFLNLAAKFKRKGAAPAPEAALEAAAQVSKPQVTAEGTVIMPTSSEPAVGPEGTMVLPRTTSEPDSPAPALSAVEGAPAVINLEPAAFWKRLLARWVDANLLLIVSLLSVVFIHLPWTVGNFLLPVVYFGLLHGLSGQTFGKKLLGIKLVEMENQKIAYPKAFLRAIADFLNMITLGVGYLMAAFTSKKQALHDIVCKTKVVSVKPVPVWMAAVCILLPPGIWVATIFTVGLSMIAAVAGPLMFLSKTGGGINVQPNININIEATEQAQGGDEEFPEEEGTESQESVKVTAGPQGIDISVKSDKEETKVQVKTAPAPTAPAPAAPKPAVEAPKQAAPVAPPTKPVSEAAITDNRPPVASDETQMAANKASEDYLEEKYGSKLNGSAVQPLAISEEKRRGIVKANYKVDGKDIEENLLLIQFQDGWRVVRALSNNEYVDWSTGKIRQSR